MVPPWLIGRIVQEILPLVIQGVRSQMRGRAAVREAEPPPPDAMLAEDLAGLRGELERRLQGMERQAASRLQSLEQRLADLEMSLAAARAEQRRELRRLLRSSRLLLGWTAALTVALIYLLLRG